MTFWYYAPRPEGILGNFWFATFKLGHYRLDVSAGLLRAYHPKLRRRRRRYRFGTNATSASGYLAAFPRGVRDSTPEDADGKRAECSK